MEISFIQEGDRPFWVAYENSSGKIVGHIKPAPPFRFQVYIVGIHGLMIPQGSPHRTLDEAEADLRDLLAYPPAAGSSGGLPRAPGVLLPFQRAVVGCTATTMEASLKTYRNARFTKRDYECTNVVAIVAEDLPPIFVRSVWIECDPSILNGLTKIDSSSWNGVHYERYGYL